MSLVELAERCERAEGPDREIDCLIREQRDPFFNPGLRVMYYGEPTGEHVDHRDGGRFTPSPHYTASLDAALTLIPSLPDAGTFSVIRRVNGEPCSAGIDFEWHGTAPTPALALCAAALRARASQEQPA